MSDKQHVHPNTRILPPLSQHRLRTPLISVQSGNRGYQRRGKEDVRAALVPRPFPRSCGRRRRCPICGPRCTFPQSRRAWLCTWSTSDGASWHGPQATAPREDRRPLGACSTRPCGAPICQPSLQSTLHRPIGRRLVVVASYRPCLLCRWRRCGDVCFVCEGGD